VTTSKQQTDDTLGLDILLELCFEAMFWILNGRFDPSKPLSLDMNNPVRWQMTTASTRPCNETIRHSRQGMP
jgi:hypothetical protein